MIEAISLYGEYVNSFDLTWKVKQPKFLYYRLLKGMQNLFRSVSRLFSFRDKSRRKKKGTKGKRLSMLLLFPYKHGNDLLWLEMDG